MHNAEAAIAPAFYDHEDDAVQTRERVAADWGADEVFATVPRRRFRGEQHRATAAPRRGASQHAPPERPVDADEAARRAAWLAEVEAELAGAQIAETGLAEPLATADVPSGLTDGVAFTEEPQAWTEAPDAPGGRRTVTITGRPEGAQPAARPLVSDRRRPPRTVEEHIGGRPDRVAGWAFGMSVLLIVVAAFS